MNVRLPHSLNSQNADMHNRMREKKIIETAKMRKASSHMYRLLSVGSPTFKEAWLDVGWLILITA